MMKDIICKHCQAVNSHYSFKCHTQRKPIGTVTDITEEWKARNSKSTDVVNKKFYIKVKPKISAISEKQKVRLARYRIVRDEYFKDHPTCEFPNCTSKEITLHHSCGRNGNLLFDKTHFKSLCMPHHQWVELNLLEAKKLGMSGDRLDK